MSFCKVQREHQFQLPSSLFCSAVTSSAPPPGAFFSFNRRSCQLLRPLSVISMGYLHWRQVSKVHQALSGQWQCAYCTVRWSARATCFSPPVDQLRIHHACPLQCGCLLASELSDDFKNFLSRLLQVCPVHSFTEPPHNIGHIHSCPVYNASEFLCINNCKL